MAVPRTLHRVWIQGRDLPEPLAACGRTWERLHANWEHKLWTDDDLGWLENRDVYDRADEIVAGHHVGQFRANIARYEILWREGGVYVDCDAEALRPIDPLLGDEAWAGWERDGKLIGNSILASPPGHEFYRRCIDAIPQRVKSHAGKPSWKMTGPVMLTDLHKADPSGLVLHPSTFFYPYPAHYLPVVPDGYGDAYTAHHWWHGRKRRGVPMPQIRSDVRLSAAIMAHPRRSKFVADMLNRLDGDVALVWDRRSNVWDTARRAWLSYDPQATHHLVLQDDVVPCRDLLAGTTEALRDVPHGTPVTLYSMAYRLRGPRTDAYRKAAADGLRWWPETNSLSGQAIVVPTAHIPEMVASGDVNQRPEDDLKIRDFYKRRRVQVLQAIPSLVQHRPASESPSLVPGHDGSRPHRGAVVFVGEDASALDWAQGKVSV